MIDIELFHAHGKYAFRLWEDCVLLFEKDIPTIDGLLMWRDSLQNELLWLDRHLRRQGIDYE